MRRELLLVDEMIAACDRAIAICSSHSLADLAAQPDAREALLWNLTVLGEAANQTTTEFRRSNSSIPWREPIDLRNRIVHGYWSVNLQILHNAALRELPQMRAQLRTLQIALEQG